MHKAYASQFTAMTIFVVSFTVLGWMGVPGSCTGAKSP